MFTSTNKIKNGLLFGTFLLAVGCSKPPTQQLSDAETSINNAIAAGAQQYASSDLNAAQTAYEDAKAKSEAKDYKGALAAAVDAKAKAEAATAAVEAGKATAKAEAESILAETKNAARALKDEALKVKGKAAKEVNESLANIQKSWSEAKAQLEGGEYQNAKSLLSKVQMEAGELKGKIESALKSAKGAKKGKK